MSLKVGDLVELKSGGPPMTVVAMEGSNFRCNWFSTDPGDSTIFGGPVHHGTFPEGSLDLWGEEDEEDVPKKFGET